MTNFATILNDLAATFEGRNDYISRLCRYPLLIIDDFGMERGTEYGLEQVYNVIDSRYRSGLPLIVTTNLTLQELQNPPDTPHLLLYLEETYGLTSEKKIAAAIGIAANENGYHPIRDYLNGLSWDGTERIRTCLHHFLNRH